MPMRTLEGQKCVYTRDLSASAGGASDPWAWHLSVQRGKQGSQRGKLGSKTGCRGHRICCTGLSRLLAQAPSLQSPEQQRLPGLWRGVSSALILVPPALAASGGSDVLLGPGHHLLAGIKQGSPGVRAAGTLPVVTGADLDSVQVIGVSGTPRSCKDRLGEQLGPEAAAGT